MSESKRDLKLKELLCRADLMETELKIARFMVLDWILGFSAPTEDELKQLAKVLDYHSTLTDEVLALPPTDGEDFKSAQATLANEYNRKFDRR
ncbi:hypothetical protein XH81_18375 [Bradyrhizobium sp. CCBAU 25360]|uniref:hypothetical protein n=1 Tax=Bradyrhizobium sp. CCBAU 25360 TaxID=858425 RepID=UPI002305BFC6|nr:hypothetical protein [Bradyrhizobium sp. CCBAU 25360]MDA9416801.1 hypothetical protein [Bradyrhizobium sp. CCBAU 25360]